MRISKTNNDHRTRAMFLEHEQEQTSTRHMYLQMIKNERRTKLKTQQQKLLVVLYTHIYIYINVYTYISIYIYIIIRKGYPKATQVFDEARITATAREPVHVPIFEHGQGVVL